MTVDAPKDYRSAERPAYVTDTDFPPNYNPSQQPALLSYVTARAGFPPPDPARAFRYLELGCGAGMTLNGLAVANPGADFLGIDLNAAHVTEARRNAAVAELTNVRYLEASFSDVDPGELDEVNFAAISGAYSWLDPVEEQAAMNIARQTLRPGGVFYLDHIVLPGMAAVAPLWRVMRDLTRAVPGSSLARVKRGMEILSLLRENGAGYLSANPFVDKILLRDLKRLEADPDATLRHLAHHALAEFWVARYVTDVHARMAGLGFVFAGSTYLYANDLQTSLPPALHTLAGELGDRATVELLKDFHVNRQTRRDVFVKDGTTDQARAATFLKSQLHFHLMRSPEALRRRWKEKGLGRAGSSNPIMERIVASLGDGGTTLEQILAVPELANLPYEHVAVALGRVLAMGDVEICKERPGTDQHTPRDGRETAGAFNLNALKRTMEEGTWSLLAAPVSGGCFNFAPAQALVLADYALPAGTSGSEDHLVDRVALALAQQGTAAAKSGNSSPRERANSILKGVRHGLIPALIDLGALPANQDIVRPR